jgi:hypothetical protein
MPPAAALSVISMLAACQATTRTSEIEAAAEAGGAPAVCRVWLPIRYSRSDTPETQRQVIGENAARIGYGCAP